MTKQLKRKFNGELFYCEAIEKSKIAAKNKADAARYGGFKARIVKGSEGFYVFVR